MKNFFAATRHTLVANALPLLPLTYRRKVAPDYSWAPGDEKVVAVPRDGSVRCLIAPANFAGQGLLWARAAERIPGVSCVNLSFFEESSTLRFPSDFEVTKKVGTSSQRWARKQGRVIKNEFTHLLVEAGIPLLANTYHGDRVLQLHRLLNEGVKTGLIWHGSEIRKPSTHIEMEPESPYTNMPAESVEALEQRATANALMADDLGLPEFVSTPDLLVYRPRAVWLPTLVDGQKWSVLSQPSFDDPVLVVLHVPSRAALKGTSQIRPAMKELDRQGLIRYIEAEGVAPAEMPKLIEGADIVLDQLGMGMYGVASVEAMAAGRVVVAHVWDSVRSYIEDETGVELPVVEANSHTIGAVVEGLVKDRQRLAGLAKAGKEYASKVHNEKYAATILHPFLVPRSPLAKPRSTAALQAQIVIPVHDLTRPIRRAVESVLSDPNAGVILVAHGVPPLELDLPADHRITVMKLPTGVGYPGVAFNAGVAAATAPWVGIMGSDDWFSEGAIDAMVQRGIRDSADAVIAPLRHDFEKETALAPLTPRRKRLQARRDRLFYRTAPLGLFRLEVAHSELFKFDEDAVAGVDQLTGVQLWTKGLSISFDPSDPPYVVGSDAKTRVTTTPRPLDVQGEIWNRLWDKQYVKELSAADRHALAEKMLVVHVLGAVAARPKIENWTKSDFEWLSSFARRLKDEVNAVDFTLERARQPVFEALLEGNLEDVVVAWQAARNASYLDWRLPSNLFALLSKNAILQRTAAIKANRMKIQSKERKSQQSNGASRG